MNSRSDNGRAHSDRGRRLKIFPNRAKTGDDRSTLSGLHAHGLAPWCVPRGVVNSYDTRAQH